MVHISRRRVLELPPVMPGLQAWEQDPPRLLARSQVGLVHLTAGRVRAADFIYTY